MLVINKQTEFAIIIFPRPITFFALMIPNDGCKPPNPHRVLVGLMWIWCPSSSLFELRGKFVAAHPQSGIMYPWSQEHSQMGRIKPDTKHYQEKVESNVYMANKQNESEVSTKKSERRRTDARPNKNNPSDIVPAVLSSCLRINSNHVPNPTSFHLSVNVQWEWTKT